jgi:hypothetical protein
MSTLYGYVTKLDANLGYPWANRRARLKAQTVAVKLITSSLGTDASVECMGQHIK